MRPGRLAAAALALLVSAAIPTTGTRLSLDDFEDLSLWHAAPAPGVSLALSRTEGVRGSALRLDFDFAGHAGWAAVRRELPVELPDNWEISFSVRGAAPGNDLEVKLVDASGENVWWAVRRDWIPSAEWSTITLKKRHFSFAWGPTEDKSLRRFAAIEFAVTARAGGRGWIALDELAWTPLPPPERTAPAPVLTASSSEPGFEPARAMDGDRSTAWRSAAGGAPAWLALDLGGRREFGGLTIDWEAGRFARRYSVETSDDGASWARAREIVAGGAGRAELFLPESEARFVRLALAEPGGAKGFGIRELVVQPLEYSESVNAFFEHVAAAAPRGCYPRSFSGEQAYWTVVGISGDRDCALFSEDGAVEPSRGAFSVEPFLFADGRLLTWADARAKHALVERSLPIPRVTWTAGPLPLEITALASGEPGASSVQVRYRVSNPGRRRRLARLFLAIRPFQVDPPQQFLNGPGGATPIRALAWNGQAVSIDGVERVFPQRPPSGFGALPFEAGSVVESLAAGRVPSSNEARDAFGYASGALGWDLEIPAGAFRDVVIVLPIAAGVRGGDRPAQRRSEPFARRLAAAAKHWNAELGRVGLSGPAAARDLLETVRTNLADILIERDGPALRPGTRAYARSWIRDGSLIASALLRLGHAREVHDYVTWFAGFQQPDGRVPCCVDRRGADPVVENDSHGELIFAIAEYWRFTKDRAFLDSMFPHVEAAVSWIDRERQRRRTDEYRTPAKLPFFGLLPESISHEGYSAKPVHSYWDDFWALKGLKDATDLAAALGREDERLRWTEIRDEFSRDLYASIARVERERGIDFIPGSADLADFDPTSTTIALDPAGELGRLPEPALTRTFERYFSGFEERERSNTWEDYTPYELRNVGAFVRLGWRDRAQALLRFFLRGRRPPEWRVWAEVVGREPRKPRFVGDIPHAWVGSDFIRSVLDLYAWERDSDGALVIASGIPADWLDRGAEVGVRGLRTPHGPLTWSMRRENAGPAGALRIRIAGGIEVPTGGFALRPPIPAGQRIASVTVDSKPSPFSREEVVIHRVPARVRVAFRPAE